MVLPKNRPAHSKSAQICRNARNDYLSPQRVAWIVTKQRLELIGLCILIDPFDDAPIVSNILLSPSTRTVDDIS